MRNLKYILSKKLASRQGDQFLVRDRCGDELHDLDYIIDLIAEDVDLALYDNEISIEQFALMADDEFPLDRFLEPYEYHPDQCDCDRGCMSCLGLSW